MANGKSSTARRREVRRSVPKPKPGIFQHLRRKEVLWASLFSLAFAAIAAVFAVNAKERPTHRLGQLITRPIVAPVKFTATDAEQTRQRKEVAYQLEAAFYVPNAAYLGSLQERFVKLIALDYYDKIEDVPEEDRQKWNLTQQGLNDLRRFVDAEKQPIEGWNRNINNFLRGVFDLAVLGDNDFKEEKKLTSADKIKIQLPDFGLGSETEQTRYGTALINVEDVDKVKTNVEQLARKGFPKALRPTVVKLVMHELQPTYLRDDAETARRKQLAYDHREPAYHHYQANEVVIPAGVKLDRAQIDTLRQMHEAVLVEVGTVIRWLSRAGTFATLLLIFAGMWGYIFAYNDRITRNPMRGLAITALLLLCLALSVSASQLFPELLFVTATLPALLAAIVLAIAYDQRFALAIGAILAVMVTASLSQPIGFAVVLLTGVGVAVSQLREVRSASKLVLVGFWAGLAMTAATILVGAGTRPLYIVGEVQSIGVNAVVAWGSGLLAGLLAQGVLPVIEKLFKVTTAMRLKDLNDASHPLLQRLAQEAPGTYQHSLRIADMAEGAAEAIDADGLACRVGAMYHDIGKINKPLYFIENQGGGPNKHSKLSPAMSLLIIVGHVKDGVEMAREYGLPAVIRHMIESHHGTTLVEYFYHAARKQTEAEDKPGPSEFEFRYPGPKPQSKEAAIMLLCDGIEAAARALPDPTPIRLEQLVDTIANKRLMDGQFSDSNLTLSELHKIEQAITKTLCAIYHARIKYPDDESAEHSQAEPARTKTA